LAPGALQYDQSIEIQEGVVQQCRTPEVAIGLFSSHPIETFNMLAALGIVRAVCLDQILNGETQGDTLGRESPLILLGAGQGDSGTKGKNQEDEQHGWTLQASGWEKHFINS